MIFWADRVSTSSAPRSSHENLAGAGRIRISSEIHFSIFRPSPERIWVMVVSWANRIVSVLSCPASPRKRDFFSSFGLYRVSFFRAFEESFRTGMLDALDGTRDCCSLPGSASPRCPAVRHLDPPRPWYVRVLDSTDYLLLRCGPELIIVIIIQILADVLAVELAEHHDGVVHVLGRECRRRVGRCLN